jgi:hypothetical protein
MGNVSCKRYTENRTILCSTIFFPPENRAVCEIIWNNIAERGRTHGNIIRHMRIACWMPTDTNTLSKYIIFIASHFNIGYTNASQYYVIRTLPVWHISCQLAYRVKVAVSPQSSANTLWELCVHHVLASTCK